MPDNRIDEHGVPQLQDKRTQPPGVLPKNAQAWVISALAAVMVLAIVLSGGKTPKEQARPTQERSVVIDPNALRIQDYKKQIEEKTQKLQAEQDELISRQKVIISGRGPAAGNLNELVNGTAASRSEERSAIRADK